MRRAMSWVYCDPKSSMRTRFWWRSVTAQPVVGRRRLVSLDPHRDRRTNGCGGWYVEEVLDDLEEHPDVPAESNWTPAPPPTATATGLGSSRTSAKIRLHDAAPVVRSP